MRLLLDECVSPRLGAVLAEHGCDWVHPRDRGRLGWPDPRMFAWALEDSRVFVTLNYLDFLRLARNAAIHPGILLLSDSTVAGSRQQIVKALALMQDRDPVNRVLAFQSAASWEWFEIPGMDNAAADAQLKACKVWLDL